MGKATIVAKITSEDPIVFKRAADAIYVKYPSQQKYLLTLIQRLDSHTVNIEPFKADIQSIEAYSNDLGGPTIVIGDQYTKAYSLGYD